MHRLFPKNDSGMADLNARGVTSSERSVTPFFRPFFPKQGQAILTSEDEAGKSPPPHPQTRNPARLGDSPHTRERWVSCCPNRVARKRLSQT